MSRNLLHLWADWSAERCCQHTLSSFKVLEQKWGSEAVKEVICVKLEQPSPDSWALPHHTITDSCFQVDFQTKTNLNSCYTNTNTSHVTSMWPQWFTCGLINPRVTACAFKRMMRDKAKNNVKDSKPLKCRETPCQPADLKKPLWGLASSKRWT